MIFFKINENCVPLIVACWNLEVPLRELKVRVSLMLSSRAFINSNDLILAKWELESQKFNFFHKIVKFLPLGTFTKKYVMNFDMKYAHLLNHFDLSLGQKLAFFNSVIFDPSITLIYTLFNWNFMEHRIKTEFKSNLGIVEFPLWAASQLTNGYENPQFKGEILIWDVRKSSPLSNCNPLGARFYAILWISRDRHIGIFRW